MSQVLDISAIYEIKDFAKKAKEFAKYMHKDQTRTDGSPFSLHPIAVAEIVKAHTGRMLPCVVAFLHDVLEDCDIDEDTMIDMFGKKITDLVKELTLPDIVEYPENISKKERSEIKTKILVEKAMIMRSDAKWVKLADRYHNLLTARKTWRPESVKVYAKQGLKLYIAMSPYPEGSAELRSKLLHLISCILAEVEYHENS